MPVLVDGQDVIYDSWQIAEYLDKCTGNDSLLGDIRGNLQHSADCGELYHHNLYFSGMVVCHTAL